MLRHRAPIVKIKRYCLRINKAVSFFISRCIRDGCRAFVIAHSLSTVRNANAILVLQAGEIIECGTHEELLALSGRYYELYTGLKELD